MLNILQFLVSSLGICISEESFLTFNPIHLIVPTSDSARGDKSFPISLMVPVDVPGSKTDDPLYTSTFTSFPAMIAAPTSSSESTGWPMSISSEDLGTNRTRPGMNVN